LNVGFPSIRGWRLRFNKVFIEKALWWASGRRDCLVGGLYFLGSPRALLELTSYDIAERARRIFEERIRNLFEDITFLMRSKT
jgi:hypothetical protein